MHAIYSLYTAKTTQARTYLSERLEALALKKALIESETQNFTLSPTERIAHVVFNDLLYVFYPEYTHLYHEKQIEVFASYGKPPPPYMNSSLKEGILFLHRFIASPCTIGSAFPSSISLINAMTRKAWEGVTDTTPPRICLDAGAGTGSFTEKMIAKKRPQDIVDVVEYDLNLANLLKRRFQHIPNVFVHNVSIFDFSPKHSYDVVVTGLPLNNFASDDVDRAFKKYESLTKDGGTFCYFEYMWFPAISQMLNKVFRREESFANKSRIQHIKETVQKTFATEIDSVYRNITPARAIHCTVRRAFK